MKKVIVPILIATLLLLGFFRVYSPPILVFAAGTPDSYGNRIYKVEVWQNIGGSLQKKGEVDYTDYTSGYQIKINGGVETRFFCYVWLNKSFASSTAEAQSNTRIYINITKASGEVVVETTEMTSYDAMELTDYWQVEDYYIWSTNLPEDGVTYYVYFDYDAYY